MLDRPSMLSLVQRANWLATAMCPKCGELNHAPPKKPPAIFRKPMIELNEAGVAWCGVCSAEFIPVMPTHRAVE